MKDNNLEAVVKGQDNIYPPAPWYEDYREETSLHLSEQQGNQRPQGSPLSVCKEKFFPCDENF